jgi:hypothetical protein
MIEEQRIKPVMILPRGEVSPEDIALMRENGFCVVEAQNPDAVRFMEPPPNGYSEQEKAAIALCRHLMKFQPDVTWTKREVGHMLAQFFIEGSPLQYVEPAKQVERVKRK